jgi:hypothetical protein
MVQAFGGLNDELVWNSDSKIVAAKAIAEAEGGMILMLHQPNAMMLPQQKRSTLQTDLHALVSLGCTKLHRVAPLLQ